MSTLLNSKEDWAVRTLVEVEKTNDFFERMTNGSAYLQITLSQRVKENVSLALIFCFSF
jgi:hypothetical protein